MAEQSERVLGIDGGGTRTAWVLATWNGTGLRIEQQGQLPGSNFRLTSHESLTAMFRQLPSGAARVGIFLAGCGTVDDRRSLSALASEIWPEAKVVAGSDRDSGIAAALGKNEGIAVNAGTGSSITGQRGAQIEQAGGWGHILGDAGGGYYLSIEALRLILREHDLHRGEREFAAKVLRALGLNNLDELVSWAQTARKMDLAMLTPLVFAAAEAGDTQVQQIVDGGARVLAEYTAAVAGRLTLPAPDVRLLGGLFQGCTVYVDAYRRELLQLWPRANVSVVLQRPEIAAAWLSLGKPVSAAPMPEPVAGPLAGVESALTEQANPRSESLDRMTAGQIAELFVAEESAVQEALYGSINELARAIELVAAAIRNGGRLFYVGAGTSGRLGVLDASEIPPTFGTESELFQGIIAGGVTALYRSTEGAEDEAGGGALAVSERGVHSRDVVCGITASGRTPFVFGALAEAKRRGSKTMLLTCNPSRDRAQSFGVEIDLSTRQELLTGSTRLKAGTATKVALNLISTGAMVLLGKVRGNSMIDLRAANTKLRDRAVRLVIENLGCDHAVATKQLEAANWNVRVVLDGGKASR